MSAAKQYAEENPLGGPAKVFDAMAQAIRAGESFDSVLAQFGFMQAYSKPKSLEVAVQQDKDPIFVAATRLADDLHNLIGESEGVAGLHRSGEIADWESLMAGGSREEWLMSLDVLDEVLAKSLLWHGKKTAQIEINSPADSGDSTACSLGHAQFVDAPGRIYLQLCGEDNCTDSFAAHSEVSWCEHRVHSSDIEYVRSEFVEQGLRGMSKVSDQEGSNDSDALRGALEDLAQVVKTMAPNLCGKAYQNANKVLAQTAHAPRVMDRLTNQKTSQLCVQHGYQATGFVLSDASGPVCSVNMANVQWYNSERPFPSAHNGPDAFIALKHDLESLQSINNALGQEVVDLSSKNEAMLECLQWVDKFVHCAISGSIKILVEKFTEQNPDSKPDSVVAGASAAVAVKLDSALIAVLKQERNRLGPDNLAAWDGDEREYELAKALDQIFELSGLGK